MNEPNDFALARRPPSALEKTVPGKGRIISGMVADSLALVSRERPSPPLIDEAQLEAWYQTGENYYYARTVRQDWVEAAIWYRKAAEQGHAKAQYRLGVCYYSGYGVTSDHQLAEKWYREAAKQGLAEAKWTIDLCFPGLFKV